MDVSGEVFILAGNKFYIFSDAHNFKNIGIYDKSNLDAETQSRFKQFSGNFDFSHYKTIVSMVTGTGFIFEIR
jgi:hypothetical protein